jgi:hypothetical protein
MKRSIVYRSPLIYRVNLYLSHGKNLARRYKLIAQEIGQVVQEMGCGVHVLEPACGTALLEQHLPPGCLYHGFDKNTDFISYAKRRGLRVWEGDAKRPEPYVPSDVVVLCDALHHIAPEHQQQVLENSLARARRRLIVCDYFKDGYLKLLPSWVPGGQRLLETWFNFGERNGSNEVRLANIPTKKELEERMRKGFGIIPAAAKRSIAEIGEDLIATYRL